MLLTAGAMSEAFRASQLDTEASAMDDLSRPNFIVGIGASEMPLVY